MSVIINNAVQTMVRQTMPMQATMPLQQQTLQSTSHFGVSYPSTSYAPQGYISPTTQLQNPLQFQYAPQMNFNFVNQMNPPQYISPTHVQMFLQQNRQKTPPR